MRVAISRTLTIGLCAYLRQMQLSVDRSLDDPLALKRYFANEVKPSLGEVAARCAAIAGGRRAGTFKWDYSYGRSSRTWRIVDAISSIVDCYLLRKIRIDPRHLQQACLIIDSMIGELAIDRPMDPTVSAPFLHAAGKATSHLALRIWPLSTRRKANAVKHLYQNPILDPEFKPIEQICGRADWLYA
jgi:hypothetical protein